MGSKSPAEPSPEVKRHVSDLFPSLAALFSAGDEVRDLLTHPGWTHVNRILSAEVAELDRSLDRMVNPLPYPEMCLRHGRRGALTACADAAQAILTVSDHKREEQRAKHESGAEPSLNGSL